MRLHTMLLSACAVLALGAATARADCAAELAALESGMGSSATAGAGGAMSKDGSVAPMGGTASAAPSGANAPADTAAGGTETAGAASAGTAGAGTTTNFDTNSQTAANGTTAPISSGEIVQDGKTAPLAAEAGQGSTGVANSDQDAMAQQSAGAPAGTSAETTASVEPSSASMNPQTTAALEKARAAQSSGDEAACMAALQEARGTGTK